MDVRQTLPEHPVPETARRMARRLELKIDGLVEALRILSTANLARLARVEVTTPFECEEGWEVRNLTWRGIRLNDVLALGVPSREARWVRVSSGDYAVPLALVDAEQALLAEELNGQPLGLEHGGPWRLVVTGGVCFTSVKWVDHLELTMEPGEETGRAIAGARLAKTM